MNVGAERTVVGLEMDGKNRTQEHERELNYIPRFLCLRTPTHLSPLLLSILTCSEWFFPYLIVHHFLTTTGLDWKNLPTAGICANTAPKFFL
jgi:hypothetical protein